MVEVPSRERGDEGSAIERWPVLDPRQWRALVVVCLAGWIGLVVWAGIASLQLGDLHKGFERTGGLPALVVTYTCILPWLLRGRLWSVVISDQELSLEYRGRAKWRLPWDEIEAWWPEYGEKGALAALHVADREGRRRRLSFGLYAPSGALVHRVFEAIRRHAPAAEAHSRALKRHPPWTYLVLGIVLLASLIVVAFIVKWDSQWP